MDRLLPLRDQGPIVIFGLGILAVLAAAVTGQAAVLLVVVLLIPVGIAIFQRPQRGVLLVAALAPFNGLLLLTSIPSWAKGWKEALVGAALAATFVGPRDARSAVPRRLPRWLPALVGLLVLGLASAVTIGGQQAVLGIKVNFFYILLGLAVWRAPLDGRERDRLVSILMGVGLICALVGLWQQVVGDVYLNQIGYEYNTAIRFSGSFLKSFSTFDQPFPFALFVMLVLLIGIPVALEQPSRLRNRLFLLATPIYLLGMLSAFVRAAFLGLAAGLLYLGFRRYRILLAFIPLAVVAFLAVGGPTSAALLSSSSFQQRTSGWQANLQQIEAHPLGVGIGSAGAVAERLATGGNGRYQPDNYYFKTLYELGVLGLWMFVLLLLGIFSSTHRGAARIRAPDRALVDGIAAFILASMAAATVDSYFEIFPLDLLFWLLVAVAATMIALPRQPGAPSEADPDREPAARPAPPGVVTGSPRPLRG
jgi:hypothetical protein